MLTLVSGAVAYTVKLAEVRASEAQTHSLRAGLVRGHLDRIAEDLHRFKFYLEVQYGIPPLDGIADLPTDQGLGTFVGLEEIGNEGLRAYREIQVVLGLDSQFRHATRRPALERLYYHSGRGFIYAVPPASNKLMTEVGEFAAANDWAGPSTRWAARPQGVADTPASDLALFAGESVRLHGVPHGLLIARVASRPLEPLLSAGASVGYTYLSDRRGKEGVRFPPTADDPPDQVPVVATKVGEDLWVAHAFPQGQPYAAAMRASVLAWLLLSATGAIVGLAVYWVLRSEIEDRSRAESALRKAYAEQRDLSSRLRGLASDLAILQHRERKRVAAFFHDDLQQLLVALRIKLRQVQQRTDLEQPAELVERAIESARSVRQQLQPPGLYEAGLVAALEGVAEEFREEYSLEIRIHAPEADPTKDVDDDVKGLLYEAARELLGNVAEHADTDRATITLKRRRSWLVLAVKDRGIGFDPAALDRGSPGIGLFSLRERFRAAGGGMRARSAPGRGTVVRLTMPIGAAARA